MKSPTDDLSWLTSWQAEFHLYEGEQLDKASPRTLCDQRPLSRADHRERWPFTAVDGGDHVKLPGRACEACLEAAQVRMNAAHVWVSPRFVHAREVDWAWRHLKKRADLSRFVGICLEWRRPDGEWAMCAFGGRSEIAKMVADFRPGGFYRLKRSF